MVRWSHVGYPTEHTHTDTQTHMNTTTTNTWKNVFPNLTVDDVLYGDGIYDEPENIVQRYLRYNMILDVSDSMFDECVECIKTSLLITGGCLEACFERLAIDHMFTVFRYDSCFVISDDYQSRFFDGHDLLSLLSDTFTIDDTFWKLDFSTVRNWSSEYCLIDKLVA